MQLRLQPDRQPRLQHPGGQVPARQPIPDRTEQHRAAPREQPVAPASRAGTLAQWRRTGASSQILSDLGLHRLRVLGTPRRQVGLAGFGLEVVEYAALPPR